MRCDVLDFEYYVIAMMTDDGKEIYFGEGRGYKEYGWHESIDGAIWCTSWNGIFSFGECYFKNCDWYIINVEDKLFERYESNMMMAEYNLYRL